MAVDPSLISFIAFLDHTALNPKVRFDIMADKNPYQLKESSAADAMATPTIIGTRAPITGNGVASPRMTLASTTLNAGSKVFTVCVREIATAAKERFAATCPIACIAAGGKIAFISVPVIGLSNDAFLAPNKYINAQ